MDDLKTSSNKTYKKTHFSNLKKNNNNYPTLLATDFAFLSPKSSSKYYDDIFSKEQQLRNKKTEILLNARLKAQKSVEKITQTFYNDEYYNCAKSTNFKKNVKLFKLF